MVNQIINTIKNKIGANGCLLAIDDIPPFIIRMDYPMTDWKQSKKSSWDYVGMPGGRLKVPLFANMSEEIISFSTLFDIRNRNGVWYADSSINESASIPTPYKGPINTVLTSTQLSGTDYIQRTKSLFSRIKEPKGGVSAKFFSKSNKLLMVSQAQSEPTPYLTLLYRNPTDVYLGYIISAEITELDWNANNYANRIRVDVEFAVMPDMILESFRDVLGEAHAKLSTIN